MGTAIPLNKPLTIATDETVLAELDTLLLRGMMAWHVRFTLTDKRAQFRVTRMLERAAGAKGDAFYIDELEDLSWSRVTQQAHIKLRSRSLRLSGGDAWEAYRHLKALVAPEETQARAIAAQRTFLPGENILLEGPIDVVVRPPLWASGTVQLTNHRVRFKPTKGLQTLVMSDRAVEVRLEEIAGFCVGRGGSSLQILWLYEPEEGAPPELEIAMEFVRGSMSALTAAFMAMGARQLLSGEVAPTDLKTLHPPIFVTDGRHGVGAIARTGTLAMGPGGFWFATADLVASVAGTSTDGLSLLDIQRIELNPSQPRVAVLVPRGDRPSQNVESDRHAFQPTQIANLMASFWPTTGPMLDRFGRLDTRDVQNLVRMNSAILPPGSATGEMRGVGAVRIGRQGRISRGWLLVLSSGALFLSLGGQVEDRCYLEGPLIDRSRSGVKDEGILHIVAERREERFAICGGDKTAAAMWKALWNHLPDMQSMAARFPFLDAITGRVGYVRLSHRQVEILARRMVTTRLERDGIGFAVGEQAPELLAPGLDVEVEMGNQEVVYCFRTHIARIDDPSSSNYVVIGLSSNVKRRDNRREAFRVAIEEEVSVFRKQTHRAQPDPEAIPATIANLSWTGLSLLIEQPLPSGTLLTAMLELEGAAEQYTFEVVHTRKLPGESRIMHGCRILDLSAGQQDHIQSAVIRQQMREVYAQEFGDPAQDDPSPGSGLG